MTTQGDIGAWHFLGTGRHFLLEHCHSRYGVAMLETMNDVSWSRGTAGRALCGRAVIEDGNIRYVT
ncbi:hypothetical protein [Pseudonocardia alaniniphila]|uniref:Uncharacterized protein n=1 Tax=Pseudonocardia alaniniphila TaxID=75291 RepID=A0ABS9TR28_9PSEU|nr:hypothetical protein [Pseudonocardia alaniniphila]MCH6170999.1 hypothetical protein [Pseudonocardia alaniniphila]